LEITVKVNLRKVLRTRLAQLDVLATLIVYLDLSNPNRNEQLVLARTKWRAG